MAPRLPLRIKSDLLRVKQLASSGASKAPATDSGVTDVMPSQSFSEAKIVHVIAENPEAVGGCDQLGFYGRHGASGLNVYIPRSFFNSARNHSASFFSKPLVAVIDRPSVSFSLRSYQTWSPA